MKAAQHEIAEVDQVKKYVYQTLCDHERLELGAFPMTWRAVRRGACICGIYFCLHGPRSVKFTAIWDCVQNVLLFYGASGERFLKLDVGPQLAVCEA